VCRLSGSRGSRIPTLMLASGRRRTIRNSTGTVHFHLAELATTASDVAEKGRAPGGAGSPPDDWRLQAARTGTSGKSQADGRESIRVAPSSSVQSVLWRRLNRKRLNLRVCARWRISGAPLAALAALFPFRTPKRIDTHIHVTRETQQAALGRDDRPWRRRGTSSIYTLPVLQWS
jgi:hypothetical protein